MDHRAFSQGAAPSFTVKRQARVRDRSLAGVTGRLGIARALPAVRPDIHPFRSEPGAAAFTNPVLAGPAQDPQVLWHRGLYYYCESTSEGIFVRVARHFLDLGHSPRQLVWAPPLHGSAARNLWAPELHFLDGRCYVYFAADDGHNANHRMWVLGATSNDPAGRYELIASLETDGWAIDGTILHGEGGQRYFVWSGWPGHRNEQQNLYIAPMNSPTTLAAARTLLAVPEHAWECAGLPICEGPQVLQRGGRTFLVYSASGSWTEHYCLGMLVHEGGDLLDPRSWRKVGPVFESNTHGWGVGHCGFVTAPDGSDWLLYHSKTSHRNGWTDREVRAQQFSWLADGTPFFGAPVARTETFRRPEAGLLRPAQSA